MFVCIGAVAALFASLPWRKPKRDEIVKITSYDGMGEPTEKFRAARTIRNQAKARINNAGIDDMPLKKKYYELIAEVMSQSHTSDAHDHGAAQQWSTTTNMMADALEADNPKLDRQRFLNACIPRQQPHALSPKPEQSTHRVIKAKRKDV